MEFKQLLQLAGDNSAFAKKKLQRLDGSNHCGTSGVSESAVASFLAQQKKGKEKREAEEAGARRKRIQARLDASLDKKKSGRSQQQRLKSSQDERKEKGDIKFHVNDSFKQKDKDGTKLKSEHKLKHNSKESFDKIKSKKEENRHRDEVEHRKQDGRTIKKKIKDDKHDKKSNQTKNKSSGDSSLSFADLMKLAKNNSESAGLPREPNKQKRPLSPQNKEEIYDPHRHVKRKVKHPAMPQSSKSKHSLEKPSTSKQKHSKIAKHKNHDELNHKHKSSQIKAKSKSSDNSGKEKIEAPIKRDLIAETISVAETRSKTWPHKKISSTFRQVKSSGERGIAAQNRLGGPQNSMKSQKHSARISEEEFEREARMLEKKRRLFELRRVTGNKEIEDDFYDDDDDLDEEDEEDANFIDDSECTDDISKHIRSIFGYDRRKFHDFDDGDLSRMESSYNQIEKEELKSARIAKIEDDYEKMMEEPE